MRRKLWALCVSMLVCVQAGAALAAAHDDGQNVKAPLNMTEFEQQVAPLAGQPTKAYQLLALSDAALANGAENDPLYAALAHGYKSHALWLRNDYARAEREAREAISAAPDVALPYFFLADALNALLRYDDAYLACLHGADRRAESTRQSEARARCRDDYVTRVTLSPEELLKALREGKLASSDMGGGAGGSRAKKNDSGPVFLSGKISAVKRAQPGDELVFTAPTGLVACRLAPLDPSRMLTPVTLSEGGEPPAPPKACVPNNL